MVADLRYHSHKPANGVEMIEVNNETIQKLNQLSEELLSNHIPIDTVKIVVGKLRISFLVEADTEQMQHAFELASKYFDASDFE